MLIPAMWEPLPWALRRSETLRGVVAKVERAEELIKQLRGELDAFLDREAPGRTLTHYDEASAESFREAHMARPIDLRFSVLTGEVLYHLRSSLDHIVCGLIRKDGNEPTLQSQFPIYAREPRSRKDIERYRSQVKGITNTSVLATIEGLQPYRTDLHEVFHRVKLLPILKELSNGDKHRALTLQLALVARRKMVTIPTANLAGIHVHGPEDADLSLGLPTSDEQRYLEAYVSLEDYGEVTDVLYQLTAALHPIIGELWTDLA